MLGLSTTFATSSLKLLWLPHTFPSTPATERKKHEKAAERMHTRRKEKVSLHQQEKRKEGEEVSGRERS